MNISNNFFFIWLFLGLFLISCPLFYDRRIEQIICVFVNTMLSIGVSIICILNNNIISYFYHLIFIAVVVYCLIKFGIFDSRFAAKKFSCYQLLSLSLLSYLYYKNNNCCSYLVITLIAYSIIFGGYFFHGWIEPFCMHVPSSLFATYLAFFYPVNVCFVLQFFQTSVTSEVASCVMKFCAVYGAIGALFVPVLFFSKTENRRLSAYLVTWNTCWLFFFLGNSNKLRYDILFLLSFIQNILLIGLNYCFVYFQQKLHCDGLIMRDKSVYCSKFVEIFIKISLIVIGCIPVIGGVLLNLSKLSWFVSCSAVVIYMIFLSSTWNRSLRKILTI